MRKLPGHREPLLAAALLALTLGTSDAVAVERSAGWGQYRDRSLGLTFDLPSHIFPLDSANEGRFGTVLSSRDGRAQLRVFGGPNEAGDSPRRYLERISRTDGQHFTYVRTTENFFVASGVRDRMIVYRRCNFSNGAAKRIGCIQLNYPQRDKRAWDAPLTRMSRSLRLGAAE
jgi:hypothetical protein